LDQFPAKQAVILDGSFTARTVLSRDQLGANGAIAEKLEMLRRLVAAGIEQKAMRLLQAHLLGMQCSLAFAGERKEIRLPGDPVAA